MSLNKDQISPKPWLREKKTKNNAHCLHSEEENSKITFPHTKVKTTVPLPSDDDTDEEDLPMAKTLPKRSNLPFRINRSAPTLPLQFEHPQQSHSEFSKHYNNKPARQSKGHRSISTENIHHLTKDPRKQMRMATMSGMDLLIRREQEKAEAKRQKPKMNPGNAEIQGLLSKLPEPGAHTINFQQIQQQLMSPSPSPQRKRQHMIDYRHPFSFSHIPLSSSKHSLYMSRPTSSMSLNNKHSQRTPI